MVNVFTIQAFTQAIENMVIEKKMSYMDAVVMWCEQQEMEIELVSKLVNPVIKEKLKAEAMDLNFLERTAKLPI